MKFTFDIGPWKEKFARTVDKVHGKVGVIGEGDAAQVKLWASNNRGDTLEISDEAKDDCRGILARGIRDIMMQQADDLQDALSDCGVRLVQDARDGILGGRVEGDDRSDEWKKRKGNDTNDYGTGDWDGHMADHLDFEVSD